MAEGYRITESGDFRITEDGASLLTEGFNIADASLSASGSIASVGSLTTHADANLTTEGTTLNVGVGILYGVATATASSGVVADSIITQLGSSAMSSTGTMTSDGIRIRYGVSALSSEGSLASESLRIQYGVIEAGTTEVVRITEAGDTRITEAGDTRTAIQATGNVIAGTLVAYGDRTIFTSQPYYKDDTTWKEFVPYVKWNGAWTSGLKIYKHTNGAWKRSY